jgi:hypothetical protein
MHRSSSSTFNFDPARTRRRVGRRRYRSNVLIALLWTVVALGLIDVIVGLAFRLPADPRQAPSSLQAYFNYGRSIQGKLQYAIGASAKQESPIVAAGWLPDECHASTASVQDRPNLDVYGMSFSNQIADQMARSSGSLEPQLCVFHSQGKRRNSHCIGSDHRHSGLIDHTNEDHQRIDNQLRRPAAVYLSAL